mgnify:CR=1 FL=1
MVALLLLVYKTKFGVAMRATSNSSNGPAPCPAASCRC